MYTIVKKKKKKKHAHFYDSFIHKYEIAIDSTDTQTEEKK